MNTPRPLKALALLSWRTKTNWQETRGRSGGQLQGVAAGVKVIELPDTNGKPVKDTADFFAAGGTAADFDTICAVAPNGQCQRNRRHPTA